MSSPERLKNLISISKGWILVFFNQIRIYKPTGTQVEKFPQLMDKRFIGIKYGKDGVNVAMSIPSRTKDGHIFVESIACESVRAGNGWLFEYFYNPKIEKIAIDGASGQKSPC